MKNKWILFFCFIISLQATAQNVGIGISYPKAKLHVAEGDVLFNSEGYDALSNPGLPPASGPGRRMMWYPDKAAFRAGSSGANFWDKDNVGNYSFAGGLSCTASGIASTAFGWVSAATGNHSVAIGANNTVSGNGSVALGSSLFVNSQNSFAAGSGNTISGFSSFTAGSGNNNYKSYTVTLGVNNTADALGAVAIGTGNEARGEYSFAANRNTTAPSAYETVFGQNNTTYTPSSTLDWVGTDRLFVIGNGNGNTRSNAVTVFKNGNVGIMTAQPNARLSVSGDASKTGGGVWAAWSDARLKKNIVPYKAGLKEILQINPVRFQYNELSGEENLDKNYVGIIAQEIEKILPSTISIKEDEHFKDKRMFDGSELIYTLINAVKEQQQKIDMLERKIAALENNK